MAYYDSLAATQEEKQREKYEELKKFIVSTTEKGKLNEWFQAYEHILSMERTIKEQQERLVEYREFFPKFSEFLPRKSSIYDVIS